MIPGAVFAGPHDDGRRHPALPRRAARAVADVDPARRRRGAHPLPPALPGRDRGVVEGRLGSGRGDATQARGIASRRSPELAAVVAAELRRAVVADGVARAGDVVGLGEQQQARLLQADALLELRSGSSPSPSGSCGGRPRRSSPPAGEVLDREALRVVVADPADRPADVGEAAVGEADLRGPSRPARRSGAARGSRARAAGRARPRRRGGRAAAACARPRRAARRRPPVATRDARRVARGRVRPAASSSRDAMTDGRSARPKPSDGASAGVDQWPVTGRSTDDDEALRPPGTRRPGRRAARRLPPCAMTTQQRLGQRVVRDRGLGRHLGQQQPVDGRAHVRSGMRGDARADLVEELVRGAHATDACRNRRAGSCKRVGGTDRSTAGRLRRFDGRYTFRLNGSMHGTRSLRHPGPLRAARQPVRPRRDDLRRGPGGCGLQRRGVREDPGRPTSTAAATSSTPPTSTPTATRRRSSATSSPPGPACATTSSWRRSSSATCFPGDPNGGGAGPHGDHRQLDETLRRLQTDYLDLYWLHNWDRTHPDRGDHAHARRPRPGRQDPLRRLLQHPGVGHRPGADHRRCCGAGRR